MHRFLGFALKTIGAVAATAVLSAGAASAATPSPSPGPSPTASTTQPSTADWQARRAILRAVIESEADVLNMKPEALVKALKDGKDVSELAKARALTKVEFTTRLLVRLTLRLDTLVDHKVITRAQAKRVLAHIAGGHVPFWDGIHRRK
jgi:hypothetical protein